MNYGIGQYPRYVFVQHRLQVWFLYRVYDSVAHPRVTSNIVRCVCRRLVMSAVRLNTNLIVLARHATKLGDSWYSILHRDVPCFANPCCVWHSRL